MIKIPDVSKLLGQGRVADIFVGTYSYSRDVAVKRVSLEDVEIKRKDAVTMQTLKHDNVVKLLGVEEDSKFRYIV